MSTPLRPAASHNSEIVLVARYETTDEHADHIAALLAEHSIATQAEPGCLAFAALRSVDNPTRFTLYERYTNQAAFDSHLASPHYQSIIRDAIRPLLAARTVEPHRLIACTLPPESIEARPG